MRPMSLERALIRARSIWGKQGYAKQYRENAKPSSCSVGKLIGISSWPMFAVEGSGATFEEAFASYERKQQWDRCRARASRLYEAVKTAKHNLELDVMGTPSTGRDAFLQELSTLVDEIEGGA